MKELMIDIETLDTQPSALVLSIGAQMFSQDLGPMGEPFRRVLSITEQLRLERTISESTVKFWLELSDEKSFAKIFAPPQRSTLKEALEALNAYCLMYDQVWANSPSFDLVILESLYRAVELPNPLKFFLARDVRTLRDVAKLPRGWEPEIKIPGDHHDPVSDCLWQIAAVRESRKRLAPATVNL